MITLHWFQPQELIEIMKLVTSTLNETYAPNFFVETYNSWPGGTTVAKSNENIVGVIIATMSTPKNARILILSVDKQYRRRGIGDMLLKALIYQCLRKNCSLIQLEVRLSNHDAIKFYASHQFKKDKELLKYYKDGEAGYLMYKVI